MIKKTFLTGAFLVAFGLPAFAFHCPADIAAIDAALPNADLSESKRAEVVELRDEGESLHKAGNHAEAVEVLAEAKGIIGIE